MSSTDYRRRRCALVTTSIDSITWGLGVDRGRLLSRILRLGVSGPNEDYTSGAISGQAKLFAHDELKAIVVKLPYLGDEATALPRWFLSRA